MTLTECDSPNPTLSYFSHEFRRAGSTCQLVFTPIANYAIVQAGAPCRSVNRVATFNHIYLSCYTLKYSTSIIGTMEEIDGLQEGEPCQRGLLAARWRHILRLVQGTLDRLRQDLGLERGLSTRSGLLTARLRLRLLKSMQLAET